MVQNIVARVYDSPCRPIMCRMFSTRLFCHQSRWRLSGQDLSNTFLTANFRSVESYCVDAHVLDVSRHLVVFLTFSLIAGYSVHLSGVQLSRW